MEKFCSCKAYHLKDELQAKPFGEMESGDADSLKYSSRNFQNAFAAEPRSGPVRTFAK